MTSNNAGNLNSMSNDVTYERADSPSVFENDLENISANMMKFPRPRQLLINEFPDMNSTQPEIVQSILKSVNPSHETEMDHFLQTAVDYLKQQERLKLSKVSVNLSLGQNLYFTTLFINNNKLSIKSLVDTGATNSLCHIDLAKKLGLNVKKLSLSLNTASGTALDIIKGISDIEIKFQATNKQSFTVKTTVII
jgi:hypothetical protein